MKRELTSNLMTFFGSACETYEPVRGDYPFEDTPCVNFRGDTCPFGDAGICMYSTSDWTRFEEWVGDHLIDYLKGVIENE